MNQRSWKDKKQRICNLIKQISDHYGGDDIEWLRNYTKEIIEINKEDIDSVLKCFEEIKEQCNL